jgi:hypothetical protein
MLTLPLAPHCPHSLICHPPSTLPTFYLLGESAILLVARIPIHSCPWFAINCSPFAASPTPTHPKIKFQYLHRQHQQHLPSRLIQDQFSHIHWSRNMETDNQHNT